MIIINDYVLQVHSQSPMNLIRLSSFSELNTATHQQIDWLETINSILTGTKSKLRNFTTVDHVETVNLNYLDGAIKVMDLSTEEEIHNLFGWLLVSVYGSMTSHKFRQIEAKYNAILTGAQSETPTPQFCYNLANLRLPFVLGRVYVDTHFTPAEKITVIIILLLLINNNLKILNPTHTLQAVILVEEVKASFKIILESNSWLDSETRNLALEKLSAIKENVGYPDWIISNSDLDNYYGHLRNVQVMKGKFFETAVELNVLTIRHQFDTLNLPLNHTLMWPMTPATVNAAYMPTENSISKVFQNRFFSIFSRLKEFYFLN